MSEMESEICDNLETLIHSLASETNAGIVYISGYVKKNVVL